MRPAVFARTRNTYINRALASGLILACVALVGCQAVTNQTNQNQNCSVTANVAPQTATADHTLLAPGDQVQFSIDVKITGTCPLPSDQPGSWSSSDPTDITISNQTPTQGLATCVNATASPATISYSGRKSGDAVTAATLACK